MASWWNHAWEYDNSDRLTKFDKNNSTADDFTVAYLPGSWKRYKRIQDSDTEYYVYDGANVLASYDSGGTVNATYLTSGLDANLSMTQGENTYFYFSDGLGSVRNIIDSSETVQNTYDYRAFGVNHGNSQNVTSPYRTPRRVNFTARFRQAGEVSLPPTRCPDRRHEVPRNRYYFPTLGIFASRDAMWADVHRGWGYVGNRPTMFVDPYGMRGFWQGLWGVAKTGVKYSVGALPTAVYYYGSTKYWKRRAKKALKKENYCGKWLEAIGGGDSVKGRDRVKTFCVENKAPNCASPAFICAFLQNCSASGMAGFNPGYSEIETMKDLAGSKGTTGNPLPTGPEDIVTTPILDGASEAMELYEEANDEKEGSQEHDWNAIAKACGCDRR